MGIHGGKRVGAGRPKGSRNKATTAQKTALSELARSHAESALQALAEVAAKGRSESARVTAACALLDRAFGRPGQSVTMGAAEPEDGFASFLKDLRARGSRAPIATNAEDE
ncbi:hypothetical protein SAMN05444004_102330 [Jannaschia faecimaris]|uniref:DUF5681 domain-containing protein n=1 Tax=Jannaschia faecimaris TaxID=1244108 RepID=A0A1H3LVM9_9RHOB|nr:hypothetical protein SAMN05444004_102330 [Jannaschia faecimaris]